MPVNLNVGAIGAVNRPAPVLKPASKQEPASASRPPRGDTAEVSGRFEAAPAAAGYGLADALAAVAEVRRDPQAALAAQANVRPQVAIVLGR